MNSTKNNNAAEMEKILSKMILSASGWRKVFARSGNEEDGTAEILKEDCIIVYYAAVSFLEFLKAENKDIDTIIIGRDTRPTGPAIEDVLLQSLYTSGYTLKSIGCAAAPEIMAYSKALGAAFIYISASHNPIGHNGIKFGLNTGGVINGEQSSRLIALFTEKCRTADAGKKADAAFSLADYKKIRQIKNDAAAAKKEALKMYADFSKEVIVNSKIKSEQDSFFNMCAKAANKAESGGKRVCIVADFNGSARAVSIDREFFKAAGIPLVGIAEKAGDIRHAILPEGKNLKFCADKIDALHSCSTGNSDKNCFLGYMPDCDGDRGNIIYWNEELKKACILESQEVFTLSVIAELAYLHYTGAANGKIAVAVNGPTSLRIDEAAACFGARVFRAEVGEANVVGLAAELRKKGFTVRILGEGSNGGNITFPASVRDPINTIFAILKLLLIKTEGGKKGLFHLWCEKSCNQKKYNENFSLTDILKTLPVYMTTPVGEKRALLKIETANHSILKRRYQTVFEKEWEEKKTLLAAQFGIVKYRSFCNNGTVQKEDITDFGVSGKGGLKIQFYDCDDKAIGFMWMRGSGTEPVFRIMADIRGASTRAEQFLVEWQRHMISAADKQNDEEIR